MPRLRVHGADLYVDDSGGDGTPVVFAHGLLWSGAMFDPQVLALKERHRCVRFDFRGQGRSEATAAGYDMDTLADDAAVVIQQLCAHPCHFVGLSMGGFVGLRLAAYRPALLKSLTLIASAADAEPPANVPKYRAMSLGARVLGIGRFVAPVSRIMFGAPFLTDPARATERNNLQEILRAVDPAAAARAIEGVINRRSVEHLLPAIRVPTQVLSGGCDTAIVPERARRTAEAIPNARFASVPKAGHTATLEAPSAVSELLQEFFAAVEGKRD